jgi:hypothetical protein
VLERSSASPATEFRRLLANLNDIFDKVNDLFQYTVGGGITV